MKLGHRLEWISENLRLPEFKPEFPRFILHLPLRTSDQAATGRTIDFYQQALDHPAYDAFWKSVSTREQIGRVRVPVFSAGGWYDNFLESDLEAFRLLRDRGRVSRIVIGPWAHNFSYQFPGVDFGPAARTGLREMQFEWFDYWLKKPDAGRDSATVTNPPVRIFVMGANRWRDEREWPLRRAVPTPFFLAGRGHANTASGHGRLDSHAPRHAAPDEFVYDPRNPVPTAGGSVCCNPKLLPWGPLDQRAVEKRRDVLVYTSPPLKAPRRGDRPRARYAVRFDVGAGYGFHGQAGGRVSGWPGAQPHRRHPAVAIPRFHRAAGARDSGLCVCDHDRCRGDEQRIRQGPSDPPGGLEQQFPALRPQPQHRP